jgi:glycerate 2-kinase
MKVLIAPDKFKNSLDAKQVGNAIADAITESGISFQARIVPMADGGEGTCEMLTEFSSGNKIHVRVLDPFFREIDGAFGISGDGKTAFVEMATASGLQLLKKEERNALLGTTFGTGQLIAAALDHHVSSIIMGVGGSGTNDAGIGMGEALGAKFFNTSGEKLKPIGKNLIDIHRIDLGDLDPRLRKVSFTAICDVSNPFYGPAGAAFVFAPQKGADPSTVEYLDKGLRNVAAVVHKQFGFDINFPGAGAGGGLGGGAKIFFDINFQSGIQFIMQFIHLEEMIKESDVVITGEGKMDEQTLSGKVVKGVAELAKKHQKPLFVMVGKNELDQEKTSLLGVKKVATLMDNDTSEMEAMTDTYALIKKRMKEAIIPFFL